MKPQTFRTTITLIAFITMSVIIGTSAYLILYKKEVHVGQDSICACPSPPATQTHSYIIEKQAQTLLPITINEKSSTERDVVSQRDISKRDRRVLHDDLYPPLNRTEASNHQAIQKEIHQGHLYNNASPNGFQDQFRLIGYLSNLSATKDAGHNNWKLLGRMKDRHQGEYYIIPANSQLDIKIPLTSDIVVGERLRDTYSLPKEMRFNSPLLNNTPYVFIEIPKTDFSSPFYN